MKSLNFFAAIIAVALFSTSCSTQYYYKHHEASARFLEPAQSGIIAPLAADLDILTKERISFTAEYEMNWDYLNNGNFQAMVMSAASKKYSSDIIVAPLFEIDYDSEKNENIIITVTGYPAKYVNFRNATEKDITLHTALLNATVATSSNNSTIEK